MLQIEFFGVQEPETGMVPDLTTRMRAGGSEGAKNGLSGMLSGFLSSMDTGILGFKTMLEYGEQERATPPTCRPWPRNCRGTARQTPAPEPLTQPASRWDSGAPGVEAKRGQKTGRALGTFR